MRFKKDKQINTAFTLIELLVVIVIIGILATVSVATFGGNKEKARLGKIQAECSQYIKCEKARDICNQNGGSNCESLCDLSGLDCANPSTARTEYLAMTGGGESGPTYPPESEWTAANCFTFSGGTITGYDSNCGGVEVVIPENILGESVTSIGNSAFRQKGLTSVTIPGSVTSLEQHAFISNQLTSVTLFNGVETMANGAFYSNQLTSVTIPNSVTYIDTHVFRNNSNLDTNNSVSIYTNTFFHEDAFESDCTLSNDCITVRGITNGGSVPEACFTMSGTTITGYSDSCAGVDLSIPSSIGGVPVESIGNSAFRQKGLTSVTIPGSVTSLEQHAFISNQLTSVTLSNGLETMANGAFYSNQLTSVTIPDSVTYIDTHVFQNNSSLNSVSIGSGTSIHPNAFSSTCTVPSCITIRP